MALKPVLDKDAWGALSEEVQGLYVERDGSYHLEIEDFLSKADADKMVSGLKGKNAELLEEVKKAKATNKEFESLGGLDEVKEMVAKAKEAKNKKLLDKGEFEKARDEAVKQAVADKDQQLAEANKANEELRAENINLKDRLTKTVVLRKVLDELADEVGEYDLAAKDLIEVQALKVFTLDENEEVVALDSGGNVRSIYEGQESVRFGPKHWIKKEFIPRYPKLFPSKGGGASPGGAGGSYSGKNPWKKESFNLTEQSKILKDDPETAKRLAAEAGKSLGV